MSGVCTGSASQSTAVAAATVDYACGHGRAKRSYGTTIISSLLTAHWVRLTTYRCTVAAACVTRREEEEQQEEEEQGQQQQEGARGLMELLMRSGLLIIGLKRQRIMKRMRKLRTLLDGTSTRHSVVCARQRRSARVMHSMGTHGLACL